MARTGLKITDWKILADLIYHRGEEIGLDSYREVANACGMSLSSIQNIDAGQYKHVSPQTVTKLAKGLQMTEEEIIDQGGLCR